MADASFPPPRLARRRRVGGEGEPEVFVADEQDDLVIDPARWAGLAEAVLADEGVRGGAELSLLFVAGEEMADLNRQFMGAEGATDVLAFPIDASEVEVVSTWAPAPDHRGPDRAPPDPGDQPLLLGDVVVCPAVAAANAPEHAGTLDDELALRVVHGILRGLGHDHAGADDAQRMQRREIGLLEARRWRGPAPGGFRDRYEAGAR